MSGASIVQASVAGRDYLNLGCGARYVPAWTNLDWTPRGADVVQHDLSKGLPFGDNGFQLVYASHVLEHFTRDAGVRFLRECVRVLRPGGTLRIVVPDLELIAGLYLDALSQAAEKNSGESDANYEWVVLMLYDQAVRVRSGGMMAEYLRDADIPNRQFVFDNCGSEMERIIATSREVPPQAPTARKGRLRRWAGRVRRLGLSRERVAEALVRRLLRDEYESLRLGRFRNSGEIHQWMYDRYSLANLFRECGLVNIARVSATESNIAGWREFNLDTEADGTPYKPESLYMEGVKPSPGA